MKNVVRQLLGLHKLHLRKNTVQPLIGGLLVLFFINSCIKKLLSLTQLQYNKKMKIKRFSTRENKKPNIYVLSTLMNKFSIKKSTNKTRMVSLMSTLKKLKILFKSYWSEKRKTDQVQMDSQMTFQLIQHSIKKISNNSQKMLRIKQTEHLTFSKLQNGLILKRAWILIRKKAEWLF